MHTSVAILAQVYFLRELHLGVLVWQGPLVGIKGPVPESADDVISFVERAVIPTIDAHYSTNPYGAARAICAQATGGSSSALRKLLLETDERQKLFRYFILGPEGADGTSTAECEGAATSAFTDAKSQIYLGSAGGARGGGAADAASSTEATEPSPMVKELAKVLNERTKDGSKDTTMFVDRFGVQHYSQYDSSLGPPVTIDLVESGSFVPRSVQWLCERWEV